MTDAQIDAEFAKCEEDQDAPPVRQDRAYVDFIMEPLREAWRATGERRNPVSLDEAAKAFDSAYRGFEDYREGRHRQWLLLQIPDAMEQAKASQRDRKKGQSTLF